MAQHRHYSPALSKFIVSVLYHEAKLRNTRMTKLTEDLLRQALMDTQGWKTAESSQKQEKTTATTTAPLTAQAA